MRRLSSLLLALLASVAFTTGCGSSGTTTPNAGSITLALSPATATIQQGGSAVVTGTIVRTNFTGDVAIHVSGAPDGVAGLIILAPVSGGNSAQVNVSVAATAPTGTYPITVTASGTGISSATATYTLTITAQPTSFTFAVSPTSANIPQGGSLALTGTVQRTNFPADIAISVTGAPTGVTTNVTQSPVSGGNTATIDVTAASTVAPGPFTLTITANGGTASASATATLTITVTGSFTIAPGSATLSVAQGSNISTSINVTRSGGFAGTPAYAVTGAAGAALPAGLTAAVTPTGTADQNTLTVSTTAGLGAGTYPVVVTATSFGVAATATVNVTVNPVGSVHLDFSQCSATLKPIWVGYQDGSGAFVHVTGTGDVYTFTVTSAKGALATVRSNGSTGFITSVQYFARDEFAAQTGACTAAIATGKTITGSTTGIVSPNNPEISLGGASAFTLAASPNFQLTNVAPGAQDLIAYNSVQQFAHGPNDQVLIHRSLNIPDGGSVGTLNFAAEGVPVSVKTVTVTGGATNYFAYMNYLTGASCTSNQLNSTINSIPSPLTMYGVPASLQQSGDFHNLLLQHIFGPSDIRSVSTSFHAMADKTIAIGAGVGPVTVTSPSGGYRLETASFTLAPDYANASLSYQGMAGTFNQLLVTQSPAWLGGNNAIVLAAPDLSAVAGFQATWGPATSGNLNYTVTVTSAVPPTMCAEGATLRIATAGTGAS